MWEAKPSMEPDFEGQLSSESPRRSTTDVGALDLEMGSVIIHTTFGSVCSLLSPAVKEDSSGNRSLNHCMQGLPEPTKP